MSESETDEFKVQQVVDEMQRRGTKHREITIRAHLTTHMCGNSLDDKHVAAHDDVMRTTRGFYRLNRKNPV